VRRWATISAEPAGYRGPAGKDLAGRTAVIVAVVLAIAALLLGLWLVR
jgi:hypothetical protein